MDPIILQIAQELNKRPEHVENVARLLDEGNTIPFIARYRKELHGSMDDQLAPGAGRPPPVPAQSGRPEGGGQDLH